MHVYEVCPRKDKRGVDLISMRCHSVRSGTLGRIRSAMPSATRCTAADQIKL